MAEVTIFSSVGEAFKWTATNCRKCRWVNCPLSNAIYSSLQKNNFDVKKATVPLEVLYRVGFSIQTSPPYRHIHQDCEERSDKKPFIQLGAGENPTNQEQEVQPKTKQRTKERSAPAEIEKKVIIKRTKKSEHKRKRGSWKTQEQQRGVNLKISVR